MKRMKHAAGSLLLLMITASGLALADCPGNLPTQLLEDCLIYDAEGESFPADDYAHMDEYQAWLKAQEPKSQRGAVPGPVAKNTPIGSKPVD